MLLLSLPIASSIHVTSLPASCILYWLSETVFSFDGDSHANVSAEQGMTWSSLLPTRPSWISSYLPFSALSLSERNHYTVQSTNRFSLNIRHSTQVDQSRVLQTFKSLFHNQLPSAATDDGGKFGTNSASNWNLHTKWNVMPFTGLKLTLLLNLCRAYLVIFLFKFISIRNKFPFSKSALWSYWYLQGLL